MCVEYLFRILLKQAKHNHAIYSCLSISFMREEAIREEKKINIDEKIRGVGSRGEKKRNETREGQEEKRGDAKTNQVKLYTCTYILKVGTEEIPLFVFVSLEFFQDFIAKFLRQPYFWKMYGSRFKHLYCREGRKFVRTEYLNFHNCFSEKKFKTAPQPYENGRKIRCT